MTRSLTLEIDDFSSLFKGRFNALFHSSLCWFIFFKLVRTFLFPGQKYKAAKLQQQAWKVVAKAGNSVENAGKDQQNTLQFLPFYNIIFCRFFSFTTEYPTVSVISHHNTRQFFFANLQQNTLQFHQFYNEVQSRFFFLNFKILYPAVSAICNTTSGIKKKINMMSVLQPNISINFFITH